MSKGGKSNFVATGGDLPEYKIVVLGTGGVGKSALTIRLVIGNFQEIYDPTIEEAYRKQVTVDNQAIWLNILDTAGQEEFSSLRDQWIREGKGFLIVYSVSTLSSFEECETLREQILRNKEDEDDKICIVLAANKCDLPPPQRQVTKEQGEKLAQQWNVPFFEVSAKNQINNVECFYEIIRELRKIQTNVKPREKEKTPSSCCLVL